MTAEPRVPALPTRYKNTYCISFLSFLANKGRQLGDTFWLSAHNMTCHSWALDCTVLQSPCSSSRHRKHCLRHRSCSTHILVLRLRRSHNMADSASRNLHLEVRGSLSSCVSRLNCFVDPSKSFDRDPLGCNRSRPTTDR
jgi:hypothetical protein